MHFIELLFFHFPQITFQLLISLLNYTLVIRPHFLILSKSPIIFRCLLILLLHQVLLVAAASLTSAACCLLLIEHR